MFGRPVESSRYKALLRGGSRGGGSLGADEPSFESKLLIERCVDCALVFSTRSSKLCCRIFRITYIQHYGMWSVSSLAISRVWLTAYYLSDNDCGGRVFRPQIAPGTISEGLKSKIFWGGMPPDPLRGRSSSARIHRCVGVPRLFPY